MMLRGCLAVFLAVSFFSTSQLTLAQQQVTPFGKAASAFNSKDYAAAESLLTEQIEASSTDPRVYYLRGLARFELGRRADTRPDFEAGARLEAGAASRINIPRFLEPIQGPGRRMLETYRSTAKRSASLASNASRRSRTLYAMYSQGRAAYFKNDLQTSQRLLDEVVRQGSQDPRVYYFRGLTLLKLGRAEKAQADFDQAVTMELTPGSRIDVDQALERVQGQPRRTLETRREEQLKVARAADRQRRREMIARLSARQQTGSGLIATSVLPRPGTTGNPATPTVASTTTPAAPSPAAPSPVKPVRPVTPPADGAAIDFQYLPPNTAVLVRLNVREIWQSLLVRDYQDLEELKPVLAQMKLATGLGPSDIESITAGTTDVADEIMAGPAGVEQGTADDDLVVVIRTRLPFDVALLQRLPLFEAATYNGVDYFKPSQAAIDAGQDLPGVYRAESKVLVLAREPALQKAIDQGPEATALPQFNFVDTSKELLVCYVPENADVLTGALPDPAEQSSGSPSLDQFVTAAKGHLLGLCISVGVDTNIELGFRFHCTDDASS
ncbi:MAG: tetratricopeptide repeat protein, partial [Planctomycetaceae bacterium]